MNTKQISPCIFCGMATEELHTTSIGLIYIHSSCLVDLEEVLAITEDEMEENKV